MQVLGLIPDLGAGGVDVGRAIALEVAKGGEGGEVSLMEAGERGELCGLELTRTG